MSNSQEYMSFLVDMIEDAGACALRHFRKNLDVDDKSDGEANFDPVTIADREVEELVRERIADEYPEHNIIGEEFGNKQAAGEETWLIDPIDGTRGYISGSPMWGVLVGLMRGDTCVAGAMRQPFTRETWVGDGNTAWHIDARGKTRIHVRNRNTLADSVVCCTHPAMYPTEDSLQKFTRVLENCQFSRLGTECLGYGMLACGYVDMVVEGGLSAYDIMPLIPIVEGAGGVVTDWQGGSAVNGGLVLASANQNLHEQAMNLLNS